jgi:uncharacterized membrane protein YqhA
MAHDPGRHARVDAVNLDDSADETRALRPSERMLAGSRLAVVVPVVLLLVAALGAFAYGIAFSVKAAQEIVDHPFPIAKNIGYFIVLVDLLLVGVTLLIAGIGLYELFVLGSEEDRPRLLPHWLDMKDLGDLKARVISMIVLVSAVSFTDLIVDFQTGRDVLYLGAGVALVIVALTVFSRFSPKDHA